MGGAYNAAAFACESVLLPFFSSPKYPPPIQILISSILPSELSPYVCDLLPFQRLQPPNLMHEILHFIGKVLTYPHFFGINTYFPPFWKFFMKYFAFPQIFMKWDYTLPKINQLNLHSLHKNNI